MMGKTVDKLADWLALHRSLVWIVTIVVLALALRLWQLNVLPPGLLLEEAEIGNTGRDILNSSPSELNLFIYLQALFQLVLDQVPFSVRFVPALLGTASVAIIYILAREWFTERVALLSAVFLAVSSWGLHLTRIGEPITILLVLIPLHLWLWSKAIDTHQSKWYVATGLSLGLFVYTDLPLWVLLIGYITLAAIIYHTHRNHIRHYIQPILIVALSTIVGMMPLILYMLISGTLTPLESEWAQLTMLYDGLAEPMQLISGLLAMLGMFHFAGSPEAAYNVPMQPHLDSIVGVLLIFGLLIALRDRKQLRYTLLLILLPLLLLPSLFTDMTPDPVLTVIALPLIALIAAIGLSELITRWHTIFPRNVIAKHFGALVIVGALGLSVYYNWQHYFIAWPNTPEVIAEFNEEAIMATDLAQNQTGDGYVVIDNNDAPLYTFLLGQAADNMLLEEGEASEADLTTTDYIIDTTRSIESDQIPGDFSQQTIDSVLMPSQAAFDLYEQEDQE